MALPTSGIESGLYLYPLTTPRSIGTAAGGIVDEIDDVLGGDILDSLLLFDQPLASNTTIQFGIGQLSCISDSGEHVVLTSLSAFRDRGDETYEFQSGGVDYLITHRALTGALSLDQTFATLAAANPGRLSSLIAELRWAIAGAGRYIVPVFDPEERFYRPPCFVAGTLITTPVGEVPVEDLRVGGLVTLATGIEAEIAWIGHRRIASSTDAPVRICAGALGDGIPRRDLVVSPDHALFLDGALIPASLLLNGRTISRDHSGAHLTYYHIELAEHGVLLAEGAPAESYLDTGNRRQFSNCALGYDPIDAARFDPCADVLFAGPRLETIQRRLRSPAGA